MGGGETSWLMHVTTNGKPLLWMYVLLEFKPVVNYALIYAIELTPEPKK